MTLLIPYPGSPGGAYKAYRDHMAAISKPAHDTATGAPYNPSTRRLSRRRPKPEPVAKPISDESARRDIDNDTYVFQRFGSGRARAIIRETATEFGLTYAELISQRRSSYLIAPRFVAIWLAKKHTLFSLARIAREFGRRDHTTIMHAIQRADALIAGSQELAGRVAAIEARLGA